MEEILYEVSRDYTNEIYFNIGINNCFLHFHQQLELLHVLEGEVDIIIDNEETVLTKGDVVVVDSFINHKYTHREGANSIVLIVPTQYLTSYSAFMNNHSLATCVFRDSEKTQKIHDLMLEIKENENSNKFIISGYISLLLGYIVDSNITVARNNTSNNLIKSILLYIEDNYANKDINLDTISRYFGYSKYYFSHLFNSYFRCNLNDYINLVRCRHVIRYVTNKEMSIPDAAFKAGFKSIRTFYRTFQKLFDKSPKEYFSDLNK